MFVVSRTGNLRLMKSKFFPKKKVEQSQCFLPGGHPPRQFTCSFTLRHLSRVKKPSQNKHTTISKTKLKSNYLTQLLRKMMFQLFECCLTKKKMVYVLWSNTYIIKTSHEDSEFCNTQCNDCDCDQEDKFESHFLQLLKL